MREVVLDTETTGLNPQAGDRLVEIGCVELDNHVRTGRIYHQYINPERDIPSEAYAVHGLSAAFLATHPAFKEVVIEFLDFIGKSNLVIHNASFDLGFINSELVRLKMDPLDKTRATDTVQIARTKFPGAQASLDALCRRFEISLSARANHGALLDAELLADVYLELIGGRQPGLQLTSTGNEGHHVDTVIKATTLRPPREHSATKIERAAHKEFVDQIFNPIWRDD